MRADSGIHQVHIRLARLANGVVWEVNGYVPRKSKRARFHRFHDFRQEDINATGLGESRGGWWTLHDDGQAEKVYYYRRWAAPSPEAGSLPYAWCQIFPWRARRAVLVILLLGRLRRLHKDMARYLAKCVYCTRANRRWCAPDEYCLG